MIDLLLVLTKLLEYLGRPTLGGVDGIRLWLFLQSLPPKVSATYVSCSLRMIVATKAGPQAVGLLRIVAISLLSWLLFGIAK